jgi:uncharacterized membrane protein (UPF0127 family)
LIPTRLSLALAATAALAGCAREAATEPAVAEPVQASAPARPSTPTLRPGVPLPANAPRVTPGSTEPLTITTAQGPVRFQVELADTDEERAQGLMWRGSMPADRGMVFDYGGSVDLSPASGRGFWMRNTYIPLDIIFIGPDGRIQSIASNTPTLSDAPIHAAPGPVRLILEINAGLSEQLGISPGDRVAHRLLP